VIRRILPRRLRRDVLRALSNERGSTIVLVAIAITALLSMVALAVDMGMLFTARGEAQRVADAAALAGAGALIVDSDNETRARNEAVQYASLNDVRQTSVVLEPEDIEVDLANMRVTVTVRRTAERGTSIGTWFARVFGVDEVDVVAQATAEVVPAGGATCMKPFTIPDAWDDENDNEQYDAPEFYDANETGYGTDFRNGVPSDNGVDPSGTTYDYDVGRPIILHPGTPQEAIVPSWYFPWDVPQGGGPDVGADRYRWNIANCNSNVVSIGQAYMVENGNMAGPTRAGTTELIEKDKYATWDVAADSVVGSAYQPWEASPRVGHIPLFDPRDQVQPGKKPVVFNNITAIWMEDVQGQKVIGRFLHASGIVAGSPGVGTTTGPMPMAVHLID
jgi:Flp pilus assembly protein TadG